MRCISVEPLGQWLASGISLLPLREREREREGGREEREIERERGRDRDDHVSLQVAMIVVFDCGR